MRFQQVLRILLSTIVFLQIRETHAITPEQLMADSKNNKPGMSLNMAMYGNGADPGKLVYGMVLQPAGLAEWEDKHILDMAFAAHAAVRTTFQQDYKTNKYVGMGKDSKPMVTTTLVIDNTAYIWTSMKRGAYLYAPDWDKRNKNGEDVVIPDDHPCSNKGGRVLGALRRCQYQAAQRVPGNQLRAHRTGASCGEEMAALAYCALVPADQPLRGGKVVTITTPKGKGRKDTTVYPDEVADPCHGNPEIQNDWGCSNFAQEMQWRVIDKNTEREEKVFTDVNQLHIRSDPVDFF